MQTEKERGYDEIALARSLKAAMCREGVSIRMLSKMTGISCATISRICNGKQGISLCQLSKLSSCLKISMDRLLSLEKECPSESTATETEDKLSGYPIKDMLKNREIDFTTVAKDIEKALDTYEQYVQTTEGTANIHQNFMKKIKSVDGKGMTIERLCFFYNQFCKEEINSKEHDLIGSLLLYFIAATDVIPDYLFPVGYLDDALAVQIIEKRLICCRCGTWKEA